ALPRLALGPRAVSLSRSSSRRRGSATRSMKVLVVGGGGREHALVWKIAQSPVAPEILCAPSNPGSAEHARNVAVAANDVAGLLKLAQREAVDLVVVGPEEPLCLGLADKLRAAKIPVFGPGAA